MKQSLKKPIPQYLYQEGVPACSKEPLQVRLDGCNIGEIRKVEGGYKYFPNRESKGKVYPVFPTVSDVQQALYEEALRMNFFD